MLAGQGGGLCWGGSSSQVARLIETSTAALELAGSCPTRCPPRLHARRLCSTHAISAQVGVPIGRVGRKDPGLREA